MAADNISNFYNVFSKKYNDFGSEDEFRGWLGKATREDVDKLYGLFNQKYNDFGSSDDMISYLGWSDSAAQEEPAQEAKPAPAPKRSESQQRTARFNEMVRQREAARGHVPGAEDEKTEQWARSEIERRSSAPARYAERQRAIRDSFAYRGGLQEEIGDLQRQLDEAHADEDFVKEYEERRAAVSQLTKEFSSLRGDIRGTGVDLDKYRADTDWLKENAARYEAAKGDKARVDELRGRIAEIQKAQNAIEDRKARAEVRKHLNPQDIIATGATPFGGDNAGGRYAKEMELPEYSAADELLAMADQEYDKGSKFDAGYEDNPVGTAIAQFFQGGINNVDTGSLTAGLSEGHAFNTVRDVAEKNDGLINGVFKKFGYDDEAAGKIISDAEEAWEKLKPAYDELEPLATELKDMEATLETLAKGGDEGKYRAAYDKYKKKYDEYSRRLKEYEPLQKSVDKYTELMQAVQEATASGLSDGERAVLDSFSRYVRAKGLSAQTESTASKAGAGAEQSLEFMLDFILTRGLGKTGTKAASKIAANSLLKKTLGETGAKIVGKGLADIGTSAIRTSLMFPRNLAAYGEQLTQMDGKGSGVDEFGRYTFDRSRANAALNTALTQYIEYWSEGFGEYFGAAEQALFRNATKLAPKTAIGQTLKNYRGSIGKYLDYGKFDGMFNEMLEEVVGSTFNALNGWVSNDRVGDKEALKEFFAGENLATLFFSFLPMSAIGAATNMKAYHRMKENYDKSVGVLNPLIDSGAIDRKELEELTSRMSEMSPEQITAKIVDLSVKADKKLKENGGALPKNFRQAMAGYLEGTFAMNLQSEVWQDSKEIVAAANAYAQQFLNPDVRNAWALSKNEQLARDAALEAGFTEDELDRDSAILSHESSAMMEEDPARAKVLYDYAYAKAQADGLRDGYEREAEDDFSAIEETIRGHEVNGNIIRATDAAGNTVFITSQDATVDAQGLDTPTGRDGLVSYITPEGRPAQAKADTFTDVTSTPTGEYVATQRENFMGARNQWFDRMRNTISTDGMVEEIGSHVGHTLYVDANGTLAPVKVERTLDGGATAVISGDRKVLGGLAQVAGLQAPEGTMLKVPVNELYKVLAKEDDNSLMTDMPAAEETAAEAPAAEPAQTEAAPEMNVQDLRGSYQEIRDVDGQNKEVFVIDVRDNGDVVYEYSDADGRTKRSVLPSADFVSAMQGTQLPAAEEAAPVSQEQTPAAEPAPAQETAPAETDFRGNPIPMKDGQVDQESFRERDPEAWARWAESLPEGDERKPSLGTMKRLQGISSAAHKAVEKAQKELEKLYDEGASDEKIQAKEKELRALTARQRLYDDAVKNFSNPAPAQEEAPAAAAAEQAPVQQEDAPVAEAPVAEATPVQEQAPVAEAPAAEQPAPAETTVAEAPAPVEEAQSETQQARIAQAPEARVEGMEEEERQRPLKARVSQWEKRTGVPAVAFESIDQVTNKSARDAIMAGVNVTGWFDENTGKVYVYLPNCGSERDVDKTYIHEVVAHKGLRGLLKTRGFNTLMDSVWRALSPAQQFRWMNYPSVRNMKNATLQQKQRRAADEFVAHLSENIDTNVSAWRRFVGRLKEALLRLGIKVNLTSADLAAIVGRSLARYERMTARGMADAAAKNDISAGVAGGVEVKGEEENQVQFSVTSIASGAGFEIIESDTKGDMVFVTEDGRRFSGRKPLTVEDVRSLPNTVMGYMMADAKRLGTITDAQEDSIWRAYTGMLNYMLEKGLAENGGVDHVKALWEWEVQNTVYKSVSTNSDAQYSYSLDITRVCKKNEATIKAISAMQRRLGYGITPGQIMDIYLSGIEEGYQVPCPVCYVFSRYINNGVVATIAINGQRKYGDMLVDPSTLSEEEKKKRIAYWEKELRKQEKANEANAKAITEAKQDCARIIERINYISERITRGELQGDERARAEAEVRALDRRYRAAFDVVSQANLTQWIKQFAIHKVNGKWELWEDTFHGFPEENALDLRLTADTIVKYPAIQRLRNARGSAGGKEIHFASNNDVGDVPMMLGASDLRSAPNYYKLAVGENDPAQREKYLREAAKRFASAHRYAQQQSLRGGQRMWSWSDNIERLAPDVFMNLMQIQMLGGALQSYSKQLEGVNLVASMGGYVNGSLMGKGRGYQELTQDQIDVVEGREVLKEDITDTVVVHSPQGDTERTRILAPAGSPVYDNNGQKVVLIFDDVVGIDAYGKTGPEGQHLKGLFDLNGELDKAGNILVGMNDIHVRAAMADPRVFFIIPWHASGNSVHILQQMLGYLGVESEVKDFTDYTNVQEEKDLIKEETIDPNIVAFWEAHRNETDFPVGIEGGIPSGSPEGGLSEQQRHYRELRNAIFTDPNLEQKEAWMAEIMADAFLSQVYAHVRSDVDAQRMTNGDTKFIYPYEYWDEQSTYDTADENGARYLEYCRRMGYKPKFVGKLDGKPEGDFGNFSADPGYWKLLIDRRMYDVSGAYQGLTPTTTDAFSPEMVDPEWTGRTFEVTKVADDPGADVIAQRTIDREDTNMPGGVPVANYGITLDKAVKRYEEVQNESDTLFRVEEEQEPAPVFLSNAAVALDRIRMEKATPEQWVKMLEKEGGLKAGEDKWIGLSDWLKGLDRKSITKQEVADYIAQNEIQIADARYEEEMEAEDAKALEAYQNELDDIAASMVSDQPLMYTYSDAFDELVERYGDDFKMAFELQHAGDRYILVPYENWDGDIDEAAQYYLSEKRGSGDVRRINKTRLHYTTEGLEHKREIALVVPTIEPWNTEDQIHFGDAGNGRAVAWVRFGDTTTYNPEAKKYEDAYQEKRRALDEYRDGLKAKYALEATGTKRYFDLATPEEVAKLASLKDEEKKAYDEMQAVLESRPRVLVIDEIQSKRHQEGREKGYSDPGEYEAAVEGYHEAVEADNDALQKYIDYTRPMKERYDSGDVTREEYDEFIDSDPEAVRLGREADEAHQARIVAQDRVNKARDAMEESPAPAPFEKNWHELAMKRILRLAAEEGYDYVAWTTGAQQAERYSLGGMVSKIDVDPANDGTREVTIVSDGADIYLDVEDESGSIVGQQDNYGENLRGKKLSDVVGKEMADKIMGVTESETIEGDGLRVGGEGMKGFYDDILPRFMNKYGKKWGVKVEDLDLPQIGAIMHSVPVTPEMKASVMEGQPLFRVEAESESDGESETLFRVREGAAPKKTQKVYKLMRLENGKLYPLFIDRDAEAIELGTWYDADSPDLAFLKKMPAGVFLVDAQNGTYTSLEDYKRERGEKVGKLPSKADVEEASRNGLRWMKITETENPQRRYEGENRKYENIGINGSEGVSTFAMRPGWHAGSLPTMRQIGKGAEKNLRDDKFVWVEGEISADVDYNEEAQGNPDKDIPTHIPTDGFYMKATNANKKASQADRVGWYVAGAFKPTRIISDSEARRVIDAWNDEHPEAPVEYDWPRESGREFNAETMQLEEPVVVESPLSSEEREGAKDFVGTLFDDAVSGAWRGKPMTIGRLTGEGKAYLESLSGETMKDVVDFVLNPSDLVHIYGDHFGENEKDKGSNIPLTREDIKNIIDVIERPDRVIYLGNDGNSGAKFAFLKKSEGGAYNLIEVYGDRRGNLTAKTFYNTKRGVSQRAMILEKESPNSTSETSGATSFVGANVPILFDIRNNSENLYRESSPEQRSIEAAELQATNAILDRMGEELGVTINRVGREEMPAGHKTDKGFYNPSTGEVTICMDNVTDERDAIATVLHETVAHKGLRDLFGSRFREAMTNIYAALDAKGRAWVNGYIASHDLGFGDEGIVRGMEEYLANLAESGNFNESVWDRIKEILGRVVDAVFGTDGFVFTDRELNYILRASYEHLKNPNWINTPTGKAKDTLMKRELGINETDPNKPTDPDGPGTGILFRDGDTGVASEDYDAEMELWHNVAVMENQNADLPVKIGMEKVMKEVGMASLSEDEDYLLRHNLASSRAETEAHNFELFYFTPLLEQVRVIQSKLLGARARKSDRQLAYERILDYMYAVSALERNEYKRNETGEDRDFAGITSLMGRPADEWREAEDDARAMIDAFRAEVNDDSVLDELWNRIRACTDFSLEHAYKHGLLTRDEYEKLHGTDTKPRMWNFYLPLRGFSEKTAEEEFSYSSFFGMSSQNPVVKKMKGRWTKADNPLANILNIAENEIVQGNDNWARQAIYNFVLDAGENSLLTEVEPWYVKDPATGKWSLAEPIQGESLEDFEARMTALRGNQPPLSKKGRRGLKLDNIMVSKAHRNEHMIRLKVGGIDKMIWVNGNPAFAKAVNGFRRSQSMQWLRRASRALSNLFTTYSLDFTAKNLIRDTIYSRSALIVKEDKAYRHQFRKNWWSNFGYGAFAFPMARLAFQWESGELQRKPAAQRTKREQMFIDFMTDGGQTGYTIINSVNEIKRSLERSMRRAGQETGPVTIPILGHYAKFVKTLNEAFELLTRFTAYETSRDMGRSGDRSALDAKEISVNFNRRGAQSGDGIWGNIASYLGATHYFYNAGVQGFDNYLRLYKASPVKMTAITTGLLMMGILTPMINSLLAGAAAGGNGDDDWYWNLPEWVRRNNLILGTGRWYLAIPLPVEFRAPYGMGDVIGSAFVYEKTPNRTFGGVAGDLISTAAGILPVNPIEGYSGSGNIGDAVLRGVVPDATVFFVDWATNRDYTGRPLWKENPFNDTVPKSQGVYASTPKGIVWACQKMAEVTEGGVDVPPGLVRDFMNNYGGGFFRAAEDMSKILFTDEERPFRYDNIPFFSGFSGHIDEDRSNSFAMNALNEYKDLSDGNVKKLNAICGTDELTAAKIYGEPDDVPEQYRSKVNAWKTLHPKEYELGRMYREGMNNKYKMKQYVKGEKKGQWYKSKELERPGVTNLKKAWKDLREYWASMPDGTPAEKSAKAEVGLEVQDAWHRYYDAEANLAERLMNYEYGN